MSIFKCDKCGCAENTAVSGYWHKADGEPKLCSECDPKIGKWHGRFPKKSAEGMVAQGDFLFSKEEAALDEALDEALRGLSDIRHVGFDGVAKHYFKAGWSRASAFEKTRTVGAVALVMEIALKELGMTMDPALLRAKLTEAVNGA